MSNRYLISGATGATGSKTVKFLLEKGAQVRAFIHRLDERSATLSALGAELVTGDLLDFEAVGRAMEGIKGAYFVYPIRPGIHQATAYFAQAAKEAGVSAIVNMSQISARREAKSHAAQDHWISEQIFNWSGVPTTHLRPTLFAEWALYWTDQIKVILGGGKARGLCVTLKRFADRSRLWHRVRHKAHHSDPLRCEFGGEGAGQRYDRRKRRRIVTDVRECHARRRDDESSRSRRFASRSSGAPRSAP
jgi:uncharacterized protein YbjT (DUF2867 family)